MYIKVLIYLQHPFWSVTGASKSIIESPMYNCTYAYQWYWNFKNLECAHQKDLIGCHQGAPCLTYPWDVTGLLVEMLQGCLLRCYRVAWGKWGLPLPGPVCLPCPHCGKWTIRNQAENYMWCKIKSGKWFRDLLDRFLNICWKIIQ